MKPYYSANGVEIYQGDSRELLRGLPDESVHCVVTSPPYWGLRDYGTGKWTGGNPECRHVDESYGKGRGDGKWFDGGKPRELPQGRPITGPVCHCGAIRTDHQIGLESTPYEYISTMRMLFAEVRRVLRADGTLWLNMGDSYSSFRDGKAIPDNLREGDGTRVPPGSANNRNGKKLASAGLKHKDLVGVPWMLAFALREDGWYLRQDIIWAKPNPMPESVTDRCTKAHEYIFLLSKSERYYYNQEAILEPIAPSSYGRIEQNVNMQIGSDRVPGKTNGNMKAVVRTPASYKGSVPGRKGGPGQDRRSDKDRGRDEAGLRPGSRFGREAGWRETQQPLMRNKRSVWEVTTQPFPEAHFATFPEDLIKPCILAGCPEGGTVLDPFGGAGTTALVARKLHSKAILLELNAEYCEIAAKRLSQEVLQFADQDSSPSAAKITSAQGGRGESPEPLSGRGW